MRIHVRLLTIRRMTHHLRLPNTSDVFDCVLHLLVMPNSWGEEVSDDGDESGYDTACCKYSHSSSCDDHSIYNSENDDDDDHDNHMSETDDI